MHSNSNADSHSPVSLCPIVMRTGVVDEDGGRSASVVERAGMAAVTVKGGSGVAVWLWLWRGAVDWKWKWLGEREAGKVKQHGEDGIHIRLHV